MKFLVLIAAVLLWTAPAGQSARRHASSARQLRQRLSSISEQTASVRKKLQRTRRQERAVTVQLTEAEQKLDAARSHLTVVSHELEVSRGRLRSCKKTLATSEKRLNTHKQALGERLEVIYQRGDAGLLEILFQASSYGDLENRIYLLNQFMAQDSEILSEYEQIRNARAEATRDAQQTAEYVCDLKQDAAETHSQAALWRNQTADLKRRISQQRILYERSLAELEENSRQIESMLRRLQSSRRGSQKYSKSFAGGFIRPVSAGVISGFGYRTHPIFHIRKLHTGVDLAAGYGTSIHSAASGMVIHSGRWGGYGNCVIIDHGSGVATLYGHCSSLLVGAGQVVKQGQVIARVGSTGLSTGPHLHFEVRRDGKPVNPGL